MAARRINAQRRKKAVGMRLPVYIIAALDTVDASRADTIERAVITLLDVDKPPLYTAEQLRRHGLDFG